MVLDRLLNIGVKRGNIEIGDIVRLKLNQPKTYGSVCRDYFGKNYRIVGWSDETADVKEIGDADNTTYSFFYDRLEFVYEGMSNE